MTVQELYSRTGGDFDAARRILPSDDFVARFVVKLLKDTSMARLREGFASGDTKMIFEGAHALKGVTANLGFTAISGAAAELADEFRPGRDRRFSDEEVNARLAALNERYDATVEEIAKFAAK